MMFLRISILVLLFGGQHLGQSPYHAAPSATHEPITGVTEVTFDAFQDQDLAGRQVKFAAQVEIVVIDQELEKTYLLCRQGKSALVLEVASGMRGLLPYVGSTVSATGRVTKQPGEVVAGLAADGSAYYVRTEPPTILEPSESPLRTLPIRPVGDLWNLQDTVTCRTTGRVNYIETAAGMFVEGDQSGTWFHVGRFIPNLRLGDHVDIYCHRRGGDVGSDLYPALITIQKHQPLWTARKPASVISALHESRRIRVQGIVVRQEAGGAFRLLHLQNADHHFVAKLPTREIGDIDVKNGTELHLSGTATFASEDSDFEIFIPRHADIFIPKHVSNIGLRLGLGLLATCLLLGICLVWGRAQHVRAQESKEDLSKLSAELRLSYNSIRDGILVIGHDRTVIHANQRVADFFATNLGPGDDVAALTRSLRSRLETTAFLDSFARLGCQSSETEEFEIELTAPDQSFEIFTSPVQDDRGQTIARIWAFYDVTEKKRLHESLVHSQKQEAVGHLAAGFAHDFNNLLTGITGSLFVARIDSEKTLKDVDCHLDAAMLAAERAASLVSKLLGFSRKTKLDLEVSDVNQVLRVMKPLVAPVLSVDVRLVVDLAEELPVVRLDKAQIEQVLLNIILNASDAVGDAGQVRVSTTAVELAGDRHVVISISDTGPGMPTEVRERIFEPFFSTKEGEGTGLGLSMSEGIVQQHGGWIECDSSPECGTEFRVYLPASQQTPERVQEPQAPHQLRGGDLAGVTVLVIDDEEIVRVVSCNMLEIFGAKTMQAVHGKEALQLLHAPDNDIDIILLDWAMPVMGGKETLQLLHRLFPALPVIVCSGYVFDCQTVAEQSSVSPHAVVQKPYQANQIVQQIRQTLMATQDAGSKPVLRTDSQAGISRAAGNLHRLHDA